MHDDSPANQGTAPDSGHQPIINKVTDLAESHPNPSGGVVNADDESLDDPKTDKLVDNIVSKEGDELLAADDHKHDMLPPANQAGLRQRLKDFFVRWWQNRIARWITIGVLTILIILAIVIPPSRYFLLNSFGVRSSVQLSVLDNSSQQPLKNVQVSLAGQTAETDIEGKAKLLHVKLGSVQLVIDKRGFATLQKKITVGWGSNPLGSFSLTPQGTQFVLSVADFLSGKPVPKVEATSGEASALSDDKGLIKLTIDKPADTVQVMITGDGYREESLSFSSSTKTTQTVKLVPAHKHVFVSKRSGKYDVYKIDADGKNEALVLAGTGSERDDMVLAPHPTDDVVAFVSTRDNQHNSDGYLLSSLILITLTDDTVTKITQSERIQIVDWVGSRLIYIQVAAGTSAGSPNRNRLISYDYQSGSSKELTSANYFNDVLSAGAKIYYAPSNAYQVGSGGFYVVDADGKNKKVVASEETWNAFRTSYDHLTLSQPNQWQDYQLSTGKLTKLSGAPANPTNRWLSGALAQ
ncbi:hypothetical protein HY218_00565 [Candidatus Saccharibacteria bacterium]|nr:hypothetical protein [Candidatus Saccharibacteria bacterium]